MSVEPSALRRSVRNLITGSLAVVFDMDGLLLDSERLARDAFVAACRRFGWEPDLAVYHRCIGTTADDTARILTSGYGAGFPYREIDLHWRATYRARAFREPIDVKAGAMELLAALAERGVPCGLATSTRGDLAHAKLVNARLRDFFAVIVCGDDAGRGKPHPDPYLRAARALRAPPARCLALEDSDNGVRAAHGAGMRVIQVPDLVEPSGEIRALGHPVLPTLHHVRAGMDACGID